MEDSYGNLRPNITDNALHSITTIFLRNRGTVWNGWNVTPSHDRAPVWV